MLGWKLLSELVVPSLIALGIVVVKSTQVLVFSTVLTVAEDSGKVWTVCELFVSDILVISEVIVVSVVSLVLTGAGVNTCFSSTRSL